MNIKSIRIGRELEHVTIILGEPSPDPDSDKRLTNHGYYDSNWVYAHIEIASADFTAATARISSGLISLIFATL